MINNIQENNWVITTKKGRGKLQLFIGNKEGLISIYIMKDMKEAKQIYKRRNSLKNNMLL